MSVPDIIAAQVLSKCGRCCCICRRFRPTMLQVHHIVPQSEGGSDEIDNLIALCITCHSDVHTRRPFTRRFSVDELRKHREYVFQLTENGKLVSDISNEIPIDYNALDKSQTALAIGNDSHLSAFAAKLLVSSSDCKDGRIVLVEQGRDGYFLRVGCLNESIKYGREEAECLHALDELVNAELVECVDRGGFATRTFRVTRYGYLVADSLSAALVSAEE